MKIITRHKDTVGIRNRTARCFSRNLVRLRAENNFSIKIAAAKLGVAESTWSQWETGKRFPPCHLFDSIVRLFCIRPCFLLFDSGEGDADNLCPLFGQNLQIESSHNVN